MFKKGLGMINFKTHISNIISYTTSFTFIDKRSTNVTLSMINLDAGIVYLMFSVIVQTKNDPYVELIVLEGTMNSTTTELNGVSSKFAFTSTAGDPCYVFFCH